MSIEEYREGSGVYKVPVKSLSKNVLFMRDPKGDENEDVGPLLHVCEKSLDPDEYEPTFIILTEVVKWDFVRGCYYCVGCKEIWDKNNEAGLRAIWSDGYGSGDEGQA